MRTAETERSHRQGSSSGIAAGQLAAWAAVALWTLPVGAVETPWSAASVVTSSAAAARAVEAADLDGDGDLDLVSASFNDDTIAWYENDGAQNFTERTVTTEADGARSLAIGDLDGDGLLDLVSASQNDDTIAWYENQGGMPVTFARRVITEDPDLPSSGLDGDADGASSVAVADIDRDGDLDIVFAASRADLVAWYANDGTPADDPDYAADWTLLTIDAVADGPQSVFPADVDGNGWLDVVSCAVNDGTVLWHESDGTPADGGWTSHTVSSAPNSPRSVHAADMDGDGDVDLLSASELDDLVRVHLRSDPPVPFVDYQVSAATDGAWWVRAVDLDRDGDMDILAASINDATIRWFENVGSPSAAEPFTERSITTVAAGATGAIAADLDGDGDLDVATSSQADDTIAWRENLTLHRSAYFPQRTTVRETGLTEGNLQAGDLDGDGDPDLVHGLAFGSLYWHENDALAWTEHLIDSVSSDQSVVVDFDQDGDLDIVISRTLRIEWLENGGSPTSGAANWTVRTKDGSTPGFAFIQVADLDRDGHLDVVASEVDSFNAFVWYPNDGTPATGGWTQKDVPGTSESSREVSVADIDGDGDPDVFVGNRISSVAPGAVWLENDGTPGDGGWIEHTVKPDTSVELHSAQAADMDGDGDWDLLSASAAQFAIDRIAWFENDGTPASGPWPSSSSPPRPEAPIPASPRCAPMISIRTEISTSWLAVTTRSARELLPSVGTRTPARSGSSMMSPFSATWRRPSRRIWAATETWISRQDIDRARWEAQRSAGTRIAEASSRSPPPTARSG